MPRRHGLRQGPQPDPGQLGAPTGASQAATFIVVVAMRLASLRWGLQTPLPADLGQKLTPRRHQGDQQAAQASTEDKPQ
jgi:hypothetical protein